MRIFKGTIFTTLLLLLLSGGLIFAAVIAINLGSATVDGVVAQGEWDIANDPPTGDFVANLYHSGQTTDKEVLGKLYLLYSCVENAPNRVYSLVLAEPGIELASTGTDGENYLKYRLPGEQNFDKGVEDADLGSFAYVGSPETGWEASFELPENQYEFYVHTNVWYNGESQTAATIDLNVTLSCDPLAVSMTGSPAATAGATPAIIMVAIGLLATATTVVVRRRTVQ